MGRAGTRQIKSNLLREGGDPRAPCGRADGTGLGLAVAQDLVSRHDGLIEFDSRPGQTIFTMLLPFHAASSR